MSDRKAVMLGFLIGAPVLLTAIVVGLLISILQAVTQIQDQTLSFVPKIAAMFLALILLLPWILQHLTEYSTAVFRQSEEDSWTSPYPPRSKPPWVPM